MLKGTATQLATNITVSGSRVEECSGVCALLCECVLDPHRKPFFVLCVEAAFLIRGHYMRLVPGSPGKGEGIRAQIRPSRPLTVPGHLCTETRPPPPPGPSEKIIKKSSTSSSASFYGGSRMREMESHLQENTPHAASCAASLCVCVYTQVRECVLGSGRGGRYVPRG